MQEEVARHPAQSDPAPPHPSRKWVGASIAVLVVALSGVGVVALHHGFGSSSSQPASTDRSLVLQIRGVRSIVTTSSPVYSQTKVTCGPGDPCTAEELLRAPNIVLVATTGVKYRLGPVAVTGEDVASASAVSAGGRWAVRFQLTAAASAKFAGVTERMAEVLPPRAVAVIVDGQVVSAPIVQSPITSGEGLITGDYTEAQSKALAVRIT